MVETVDKVSQTPLSGARVVMHPYRAGTYYSPCGSSLERYSLFWAIDDSARDLLQKQKKMEYSLLTAAGRLRLVLSLCRERRIEIRCVPSRRRELPLGL